MVQASTYENEKYLPDDYIATLEETYPSELISAYIMGEFVNLTSGTVYNAYDRVANRSAETIQEKELLFIGMDFNVTNMSAVVYVHRDKEWHAVDDASVSDISLLESAGFSVYNHKKNPYVKDRVLSTNKAFIDKRLMINDKMCPEYARCMEQLTYDANGEPDKKSNIDHLQDAGTYPIAYEMPINKPSTKFTMRF